MWFPQTTKWIALAIHSGAWLYTLLIIGLTGRFVKTRSHFSRVGRRKRDFAQDRRAARARGGRHVGGIPPQRRVGQQRKGDRLFRVVRQAQRRMRSKRCR